MKKLVPALAGCLCSMMPLASNVHADIGSLVTATLSCTDGHSVVLTVDQLTLSSLATDVQAINASGSNLCTLDTAATTGSSETSEWTVYDYNPSGQAISPRNSPNSMPATTTGTGNAQFNFRSNIFTALFTTTDPNLTGNVSGRQLTDKIDISPSVSETFMTQHNGGDCISNTPAAVRFYFVSPSASGSSVGSPPAGFYTKFWWSNPVNLPMGNGQESGTITANISDPNEWSDWNGQKGTVVPEAFAEASLNVQSIGLSVGGECFFETGVTPVPATDSEVFTSQFSETP